MPDDLWTLATKAAQWDAAQEEIDRLRDNAGWLALEAENRSLREVVEAARALVKAQGGDGIGGYSPHECAFCDVGILLATNSA